MKSIHSEPRNILLTCPQRLGDVLLATALARSLKQAWPLASIDMLVFKGTESVLAGNSDIRRVILQAPRATLTQRLKEFVSLWRRYDLGVAAIPTDRARISAWIAARFRVGFLTQKEVGKSKGWLLDRYVVFDDLDTHTIQMQARLAALLDILPSSEIVLPQVSQVSQASLSELSSRLASLPFPLVVLHPCPKFRYKMWQAEAWGQLANWLITQKLSVVFTGSGDADERVYVNAIAERAPVACLNLVGQLSLAGSAALLKRAVLYVGPDTVMTHMAAAAGTSTIALFGPSNPVKWGPWPLGWSLDVAPWARVGSAQRGNVLLLQGRGDCVPCMLEGCERHVDSESACLQALDVSQVIAAAKTFLVEYRSGL